MRIRGKDIVLDKKNLDIFNQLLMLFFGDGYFASQRQVAEYLVRKNPLGQYSNLDSKEPYFVRSLLYFSPIASYRIYAESTSKSKVVNGFGELLETLLSIGTEMDEADDIIVTERVEGFNSAVREAEALEASQSPTGRISVSASSEESEEEYESE